LNKIFIKHSHTSGGSEKNSHTCVKIQDKLMDRLLSNEEQAEESTEWTGSKLSLDYFLSVAITGIITSCLF